MAQRPNIIFSMCDDQRHDCMGCAGHPFIETPAMDRLAGEGIRFANGFTAIPLCAPSRATHMTGVYPHHHGVVHNRAPLNEGITTWPELLQQAGYRTAFFGKIHYGAIGIPKPGGDPKPGFDRWVGFRGQGLYDNPTFIIDGEEVSHTGYNTDLLADYAEQFLDEADDRPWALCLWYKAPHGPFTPPGRYTGSYADVELQPPSTLTASTDGRPHSLRTGKPMGHEQGWYPDGKFIGDKTWEVFMRDYVRTVRAVDDALGRMLRKLDEMGVAENTLVVHTSDHGYFHGEFGLADKRWMYEPSIRVPYLIRYPEVIQNPGQTVEELVLSLDIPATIMDVTGLGIPENYRGHSLRPLMTGDDEWPREAVFIEYFEDAPFPALPTMICLRTADEKLIHYLREGEGDEFYDLARDAEERHNVIHDPAYADRVARMQNRLEETKARYGFTVPDLSKQY